MTDPNTSRNDCPACHGEGLLTWTQPFPGGAAVRDTRQRVWLSLTKAGRSAYQGHVAALRRIVGDNRA